MRFLVDANVLSEATKVSPDPNVLAWLTEHEPEVAVNPIVLGELYLGILALPSGKKRQRLEVWFLSVSEAIECLPIDAATGLRWARLVADLRRKGRAVPLLDSLIAATALAHDLIVATRNTRDFAQTGVQVIDPFRPPRRTIGS